MLWYQNISVALSSNKKLWTKFVSPDFSPHGYYEHWTLAVKVSIFLLPKLRISIFGSSRICLGSRVNWGFFHNQIWSSQHSLRRRLQMFEFKNPIIWMTFCQQCRSIIDSLHEPVQYLPVNWDANYLIVYLRSSRLQTVQIRWIIAVVVRRNGRKSLAIVSGLARAADTQMNWFRCVAEWPRRHRR